MLFLVALVVAIVLGIIGVAVEGMLYLFSIGAAPRGRYGVPRCSLGIALTPTTGPLTRRLTTSEGGVCVMTLFLLLAMAAVVVGIIGAVAEGLGYLLIIGIVLLGADLAFIAVRWSRSSGRHPIR
ncbi:MULTISPECIES: hypothetical protein [unclassified Streptomyces]|uniref:hypothetical protein n=1 Tax=unclassified Streptomyces TaxID=2593676 RepID=UPI002DDBD2F6|nr:hypothetical protein [Streptomyces sp. NBC_01750]WSB05723.1 hypothetical protein OIE54_04635 [Streptomyces sp. NBC_01794]WSD38082.1 hypothetical protein OG966_36150 [Streptomyces sp. NBC_01750]